MRRLSVVEGLPHVALCGEYQRLETLLVERRFLEMQHLLQPLEHLPVGELRVAQHRAARLDGLDDLLGEVARERKASRRRVDLHCATHGLLGSLSHRVSLVKDDDLVLSRRQSHLLLCKRFDAPTHHLNTTVVGRVQLEDTLLEGVTQKHPRKSEHARCLSCAGRAREDEVGHIALLGEHCQSSDRLFVANNVRDHLRPVLFQPGHFERLGHRRSRC
mmetsp:Transcript_74636/g.148321  ORF Transcript_74636/g.148321 Transcript_74636/m.148321 type:complete len:217 (-) Transcript_74636:51-701(-)